MLVNTFILLIGCMFLSARNDHFLIIQKLIWLRLFFPDEERILIIIYSSFIQHLRMIHLNRPGDIVFLPHRGIDPSFVGGVWDFINPFRKIWLSAVSYDRRAGRPGELLSQEDTFLGEPFSGYQMNSIGMAMMMMIELQLSQWQVNPSV